MDRKAESSFALARSAVNIRRSKFSRPLNVKFTCDAAKLMPLEWQEVLPGDSISCDMTGIIRMIPSIHATMDTAYIDTFAFFIPNRLLWKNWEDFITGGDQPSAWTTPNSLTIPVVSLSASNVSVGSIYDSFGLPVGVANEVNVLPLRAYNLIFNTFFRDENLQSDVVVNTGDTGDVATDYQLLDVNKFHDLYTSCLPLPQKGAAVNLPLGTTAPIVSSSNLDVNIDTSILTGLSVVSDGRFSTADTNTGTIHNMFYATDGTVKYDNALTGNAPFRYAGGLKLQANANSALVSKSEVESKLVADLSTATAATINQLRLAFQTQMLYEQLARTGSRYVEYIKGIFQVVSPDYRLQRPEYLGGSRVPINITQITQTSETNTTALGDVAGQSATRGQLGHFSKSFTEHGIIIWLYCIRNVNSYAQCLDKKWSKSTPLDFYNPIFANIGEVPLLRKEVASLGSANGDNEVFGYQEAWYDYLHGKSSITGYFRPGINGTLDSWHYSDYYTSKPILGSTWIKCDKANINRTLTVQSGTHQFFGNILANCIWTRPMPVASIPGRIDHAG